MADNKSQREMPPTAARDFDLYAQIAAGDEIESHTQKRDSFLMSFMVWYMRMTLTLDEKRREYQNFFRFLNQIWFGAMAFLYACGLTMFCILVISYLRFPTYIRSYLDDNGIKYEKMNIPGYIISQIDLYGLHNADNSYHIGRLSVSSTFSDFLNRRAKSISVQDVKLVVEQDKPKTKELLTLLSRLNGMAKESKGIRVDSLDVSGAMITMKGKNYELPVSFSLTGVYGRETNVVSSLSIDEPYLSLKGSLNVKDTSNGTTWDLDIQSGSVAFPQRPHESLNGKVTVQTNRGNIQKITANLDLLYDRLKKVLAVSLNKERDAYRGTTELKWIDVSNAMTPVERTKVNLTLDGLAVASAPGGDVSLKTVKPIQLGLKTIYSDSVQIEDLSTTLKGELSCLLSDKCTYNLKEQADIRIKQLQFPVNGQAIKNNTLATVQLNPTSDFISFIPSQGLLTFNLDGKNFSLNGKQLKSNTPSKLSIGKGSIKGNLGVWDKNMVASLYADQINYEGANQTVSNATFVTNDIFQSSELSFKAANILLKNNPYLAVPFSVVYTEDKGMSGIELTLKNEKVRLIYGGYCNLDAGLFDGQIVIPAFDLAQVKVPLSQISTLFPSDVKNASGKFFAYGKISGSVLNGLKGPLYIGLSDVSFEKNKLKIENMNTVLTASSISPFLTEAKQDVYISKIDSSIPLTNINMTVKLSEQYAQLEKLSAQIAGVTLYGEETLLPYKDIGTLVYLRNRDNALPGIERYVLPKNWRIGKNLKGSLLFPIAMKDGTLNFRHGSLQLSSGTINYIGLPKEKPAFLGKEKQFDIRSGNLIVSSVEENSSEEKEDELQISTTLDVVLSPSNTKKSIRESFKGKVSDVTRFIETKTNHVPNKIKESIRYMEEQIKDF